MHRHRKQKHDGNGGNGSGHAQPDRRPLFISTSLGNTILPRDSAVFVKIGDDTFTRKAAEDLREGEKVLYEKEGIDYEQERERIDTLLGQGRKYRNAMSSLFIHTEQGYTTTFLARLLRGALERPGEWPEELSQNPQLISRMLNGSAVLSDAMRNMAAQTIHSTLSANLDAWAKAVTVEHIENGWLTGKVIAPRDFKEVFWALGRLAPGLVELLGTPGFERDYWMYRAMRLSISLRLSAIMTGNGNGPAAAPKAKNPDTPYLDADARQELDQIVDFFAQEVDSRFAVASVVSVKPMKPAEGPGEEKNGERLRKGIVAKKPDYFGPQLIGITELQRRLVVLNAHIAKALDVFKAKRHPERMPSASSPKDEREDYIYSFLPQSVMEHLGMEEREKDLTWAMERMRRAGVDFGDYFASQLDPEVLRRSREYGLEAYRALLDGTIDGWCGLEPGSVLSLFKTQTAYASALPREVHYEFTLSHFQGLLMHKREGTVSPRLEEEMHRAEGVLKRKGCWGEPGFLPERSIWNFTEHFGSLEELMEQGVIAKADVDTIIYGADDRELDRIHLKMEGALLERLGFSKKAKREHEDLRMRTTIFADEKEALLQRMGLLETATKIAETRGAMWLRSLREWRFQQALERMAENGSKPPEGI